MIELRQSTAATLRVGPAVAVADGFTPVTTLALSTADEAELLKHTGGVVDISGATFAAITSADGWYDLSLTTSLTDTLGMLTVVINDDSLILPIHVRAMVLTAAAWDAKYGVLKDSGVLAYGTLSGTHSSTTADLGTNAPANDITGATLMFPDDALARVVDSYDTGTGIATFSPSVAVTLTNGDNWVLFASPPASTGVLPDVNVAKVGTSTQSATDLKHFADEGYDPATSKVQGVVLVDTVTALTGLTVASGTIGATGNTTTTLHLDGLAHADDELNDYLLLFRDVSTGINYARWITDWVLSTELATVATLPTPEASVDTYSVLAIRQDVTGGAGLDAAGVRAAVGLAAANLDTQLGDLPTNAELATALGTADDAVLAAIATADGKLDTLLTSDVAYKKNTAVTAFGFYLEDTAGDPATGKTVTCEISKDGGAMTAVGGAVTEISDGCYEVDLTNTEMNADEILFIANATGCKQTTIKLRTQA